jgi:hypothetical protein
MSRRGEQGNSGSSQQSASDAEFRASFSLLPHVNNILASLSQSDHSAVEKTVGYTMRKKLHCDMLYTMAKVSELDAQVRRCQQLLSNCPYLDLSEDEQKTLLEGKMTLLQEKRCAVMVGASETFNPLLPPPL